MQILNLDIKAYSAAESDLCGLHRASEEDEEIELELNQLHAAFAARYPQSEPREKHEFPDWHHHLRLFWVYLYHDEFYTPEFIPFVQQLLRAQPRSWFAEFECSSPALVDEKENPNGWVGGFLIYKDTVIFDGCERWPLVQARLGM
jgi:hypothetical protein